MPEPTTPAAGVAVGDRFSRVHTFTPASVIAFARDAGDDNPLHHDAELAAGSRYGGLIASGTHTTALLLGLTASHFSRRGAVVGVAFSVRFLRAVGASETVTLEWTIEAIRPHATSGGRLLDLQGTLTDSARRVCLSATGTVLIDFDT